MEFCSFQVRRDPQTSSLKGHREEAYGIPGFVGCVVSLGPLSSDLEGESSPRAHTCVAAASRTFRSLWLAMVYRPPRWRTFPKMCRERLQVVRPVLGCGVFTLQVINVLCLRLSVPSPLSGGSNLPSLLSAPPLPPDRVPV